MNLAHTTGYRLPIADQAEKSITSFTFFIPAAGSVISNEGFPLAANRFANSEQRLVDVAMFTCIIRRRERCILSDGSRTQRTLVVASDLGCLRAEMVS